jgi:aspartyl-tRNA(Asn)/glutamyl-tRNA(Gln) amidotransferase subunit B
MRSKEESSDYRYFPEPDLVPIEISDARREAIRANLPELPAARRARFTGFGLDAAAVAALTSADPALGALLDDSVASGADPRTVANWLLGEVTAFLRRGPAALDDVPLTAEHLAELERLVSAGDLSATAGKQVLNGVMEGEGSPAAVARRRDLMQISDAGELAAEVDQVLAAHPEEFRQLLDGESKVLGFLVGRVMKATAGKADPKVVSSILREKARG